MPPANPTPSASTQISPANSKQVDVPPPMVTFPLDAEEAATATKDATSKEEASPPAAAMSGTYTPSGVSASPVLAPLLVSDNTLPIGAGLARLSEAKAETASPLPCTTATTKAGGRRGRQPGRGASNSSSYPPRPPLPATPPPAPKPAVRNFGGTLRGMKTRITTNRSEAEEATQVKRENESEKRRPEPSESSLSEKKPKPVKAYQKQVLNQRQSG